VYPPLRLDAGARINICRHGAPMKHPFDLSQGYRAWLLVAMRDKRDIWIRTSMKRIAG